MSISTCTNKTVILLLLHQSKEKKENEPAERDTLFEKSIIWGSSGMDVWPGYGLNFFLIQCLLS